MSESILVHCWRGGEKTMNFGEWFCEIILSSLGFAIEYLGKDVRADPNVPCLLMVGSEFHRPAVDKLLKRVDRLLVWGYGNGRGATRAVDMRRAPYRERIRILALRGPLTKRVSHFAGDVPLCDPGFLLPQLHPRSVGQGERHVIYVPHHSNRPGIEKRLGLLKADSWINVIMPRGRLERTMQGLWAAKFVLTNSLHVFIFCLAYRVPCAVSLLPGERLNMPDKWQDIMESMDGPSLKTVQTLQEGQRWWDTVGSNLVIPDQQAMLGAFPGEG